ncbi:hypothetical protein [Gemella morbillorum]
MDLDDEELKATRMMNGADRNSKLRVKNDIEVNEYVRINSGLIFKVNEITYDEEYKDYLYKESFLLVDWKENIVKHSKQLIDLIENKDILKVRIDKTIMFFGIDESTSDIKYKEIMESIENGECELLEILTHQQFESNCYKVGGEDDSK